MGARLLRWFGRWWSVLLAGVTLVAALLEWRLGDIDGPAWVVVVLMLGAAVGIAFLARYTALAAAGIVGITILVALIDLPALYTSDSAGIAGLAAVAGFGTLAALRDRLLGLGASVATAVAVVLGLPEDYLRDQGFDRSDHLVSNVILIVVTWAIAWAISNRVRATRDLRARAETLQRERDLIAREAVAEERARVARELHDVVAHSVSVMTVQAGGVRRLLGADQVREREALAAIEETGRTALAEMRRMVGVMRTDPAAADLAPLPGLAGLERLTSDMRDAGLEVSLDVADLPPLPAGLDLAAYRIVQEGLTNVLKHAGPARAWVRVRREDGALVVEVDDDGRGPGENGTGGGHGLIGIRERAAIYDGEIETGPRPGGGFRIRAALPFTTVEA